MHTILGSGGAIGISLARALPDYYDGKIRLVSRKPQSINPDDELFPADIIDKNQLDQAIKGSEVTYLTLGLEYKTRIWQEKWPVIMSNIIASCKRHRVKLVFFDNIYMYDKDQLDPMTEETQVNPSSKKGKVRAEIAQMITSEVEKKQLTALIARAADFLGPKNSLFTEMVIKNLMKGKKASWFGSVDKVHNFTYTPDAGRAVAILGNSVKAYNQVWHLPTGHQRLTIRDWTTMVADKLNVKTEIRILPVNMMGMMGIFVPVLKEFKEMAYQYDRDYYFDSSKFEKEYQYAPTPPEVALEKTMNELQKNQD